MAVDVPLAGVLIIIQSPLSAKAVCPRESMFVITEVPLLKVRSVLLWGLQPEATAVQIVFNPFS